LGQNTALLQDLAVSFHAMKNEGALKIGTLKRWILEWVAHFTPCAIPSKTFICLPFAGGISAYAVILPRPEELI
jgi:hypothetical protein